MEEKEKNNLGEGFSPNYGEQSFDAEQFKQLNDNPVDLTKQSDTEQNALDTFARYDSEYGGTKAVPVRKKPMLLVAVSIVLVLLLGTLFILKQFFFSGITELLMGKEKYALKLEQDSVTALTENYGEFAQLSPALLSSLSSTGSGFMSADLVSTYMMYSLIGGASYYSSLSTLFGGAVTSFFGDGAELTLDTEVTDSFAQLLKDGGMVEDSETFKKCVNYLSGLKYSESSNADENTEIHSYGVSDGNAKMGLDLIGYDGKLYARITPYSQKLLLVDEYYGANTSSSYEAEKLSSDELLRLIRGSLDIYLANCAKMPVTSEDGYTFYLDGNDVTGKRLAIEFDDEAFTAMALEIFDYITSDSYFREWMKDKVDAQNKLYEELYSSYNDEEYVPQELSDIIAEARKTISESSSRCTLSCESFVLPDGTVAGKRYTAYTNGEADIAYARLTDGSHSNLTLSLNDETIHAAVDMTGARSGYAVLSNVGEENVTTVNVKFDNIGITTSGAEPTLSGSFELSIGADDTTITDRFFGLYGLFYSMREEEKKVYEYDFETPSGQNPTDDTPRLTKAQYDAFKDDFVKNAKLSVTLGDGREFRLTLPDSFDFGIKASSIARVDVPTVSYENVLYTDYYNDVDNAAKLLDWVKLLHAKIGTDFGKNELLKIITDSDTPIDDIFGSFENDIEYYTKPHVTTEDYYTLSTRVTELYDRIMSCTAVTSVSLKEKKDESNRQLNEYYELREILGWDISLFTLEYFEEVKERVATLENDVLALEEYIAQNQPQDENALGSHATNVSAISMGFEPGTYIFADTVNDVLIDNVISSCADDVGLNFVYSPYLATDYPSYYEAGGVQLAAVENERIARELATGKYLELSELAEYGFDYTKQDFYDYGLELGNRDGGYYALPLINSPGALYYNTKLAEKYLGVTSPEEFNKLVCDWDSFIETGKKVYRESGGTVNMLYSTEDLYQVLSMPDYNYMDTDTIYKLIGAAEMENLVKSTSRDDYGMWDQPWYDGFYDESVLCYFGATWFEGYIMTPEIARNAGVNDGFADYNDLKNFYNDPSYIGMGSYGDWGAVMGPQGFFWGGTSLLISAKCDKAATAKLLNEVYNGDNSYYLDCCSSTGNLPGTRGVTEQLLKYNPPTYCFGGQCLTEVYDEVANSLRVNADIFPYVTSYYNSNMSTQILDAVVEIVHSDSTSMRDDINTARNEIYVDKTVEVSDILNGYAAAALEMGGE